MQKEFTAQEKIFLGDTPYRWIRKEAISYENNDLTEKLLNLLEEHGMKICRQGRYTTEFCKS